jgi:hypothetical protein
MKPINPEKIDEVEMCVSAKLSVLKQQIFFIFFFFRYRAGPLVGEMMFFALESLVFLHPR